MEPPIVSEHRPNAAGVCIRCLSGDLGLAAVRELLRQIEAAGGNTDDVWIALDAMVATFVANHWPAAERDAVIDLMGPRVKTILALAERKGALQQ
jgi:hypothetical protein